MRLRLPPVAFLALAFVLGSVAVTIFASPLSHVPSLTPLALLVLPFLRPVLSGRIRPPAPGRIHLAVATAILAGALLTHARRQTAAEGRVSGWFQTAPAPPALPGTPGHGARPFRLVDGLGCRGEVRVIWRPPSSSAAVLPAAGQPVTAAARWQRSQRREVQRPRFAGVLVLEDVQVGMEPLGFRASRARARLRGRVETWMRRLFPDTWPVASALILARKE